LSQGPPTKEWAWRLRTKSSTRSASCGYRLGECHGWKISPEDLKISNRLAQTNVLSILATAYRSFRQTTERKSERRSDRRYDKAHYLFHAVVGWVSCSGASWRGQVGVGAGGRRTEVGRLGGGSVGSGGGRVVRRQSGGQARGGHGRFVRGPTGVPFCIGFKRSWAGSVASGVDRATR